MKNELGYSDCTESLVLQKFQKINFENEVVFVAKYKKKVIGFVHAQIYDVLYYESIVNILGLAVDSKFTKNELVNLLWQKLKNGQNLKHKINSSKFRGHQNTELTPQRPPRRFSLYSKIRFLEFSLYLNIPSLSSYCSLPHQRVVRLSRL